MVLASEIAAALGRELVGADLVVEGACSIVDTRSSALGFLVPSHPDRSAVLQGRPGVVWITDDARGARGPVIVSPEPRADFARAVQQWFVPPVPAGISPHAVIDATAQLGDGVAIGPFAVIGPGVEIGDGTVVRSHVVLAQGTRIGRQCLVKSHAVIGEEGFGFVQQAEPVRVPHLGGVLIGDHVEVGAGTVIARGTLGDTVVHDHVKIDDRVFVAHNVRIGHGTFVIAGAEISGSVVIGDAAWIGPQACLLNKVNIGTGGFVGIGAVVTKDVPDHTVVAGNPARRLRPTSGSPT